MRIAFDLDGTLISCRPRQINLLRAILTARKKNFHLNELWNLKRNGLNTIEALKRFKVDDFEAQAISFEWSSNIEDMFWLNFDRPFLDVIYSINRFKNIGIEVYLATSRKNKFNLHIQLQNLNMLNLFDDIFVASPTSTVADKSKFLSDKKINYFLGDTELDFNASKDAGVDFVGLSSGQRSREFLIDNGIPIVFDTIKCAADYIINA